MSGQIFPDCKGQERGFVCKLRKAFSRHPHLHSPAKLYFKFVIASLVLQPMAGSAWVTVLREKTFGGGVGRIKPIDLTKTGRRSTLREEKAELLGTSKAQWWSQAIKQQPPLWCGFKRTISLYFTGHAEKMAVIQPPCERAEGFLQKAFMASPPPRAPTWPQLPRCVPEQRQPWIRCQGREYLFSSFVIELRIFTWARG